MERVEPLLFKFFRLVWLAVATVWLCVVCFVVWAYHPSSQMGWFYPFTDTDDEYRATLLIH
eukprot:g58820.t1